MPRLPPLIFTTVFRGISAEGWRPRIDSKRPRETFPPVQNKFAFWLTGPVNHGALSKVNCFAQHPSAEMRGGFLRCGFSARILPPLDVVMAGLRPGHPRLRPC